MSNKNFRWQNPGHFPEVKIGRKTYAPLKDGIFFSAFEDAIMLLDKSGNYEAIEKLSKAFQPILKELVEKALLQIMQGFWLSGRDGAGRYDIPGDGEEKRYFSDHAILLGQERRWLYAFGDNHVGLTFKPGLKVCQKLFGDRPEITKKTA